MGEVYITKLPDGSERHERGIRYRAIHRTVMDLYLSAPQWRPVSGSVPNDARNLINRDEWLHVVVEAGEEVVLPASVQYGIHQHHCNHPRCTSNRAFCRNEDHAEYWIVVGGLGPNLQRIDRPNATVHPTLKGEPYAVEPVVAQSTLDSHLMARARRAVVK